jgi:hypothetical protein
LTNSIPTGTKPKRIAVFLIIGVIFSKISCLLVVSINASVNAFHKTKRTGSPVLFAILLGFIVPKMVSKVNMKIRLANYAFSAKSSLIDFEKLWMWIEKAVTIMAIIPNTTANKVSLTNIVQPP